MGRTEGGADSWDIRGLATVYWTPPAAPSWAGAAALLPTPAAAAAAAVLRAGMGHGEYL